MFFIFFSILKQLNAFFCVCFVGWGLSPALAPGKRLGLAVWRWCHGWSHHKGLFPDDSCWICWNVLLMFQSQSLAWGINLIGFVWFCMIFFNPNDTRQNTFEKDVELLKEDLTKAVSVSVKFFLKIAVASNNISTYQYYQYFLPGDRRPHWQIQERRLPQKVFLEPCNIEWWKLRSATRLCKDFRRTGMFLEVDMLFKWQTTKLIAMIPSP